MNTLPEVLETEILNYIPVGDLTELNTYYNNYCFTYLKQYADLLFFLDKGINEDYYFPDGQEEYFDYNNQRHLLLKEFFEEKNIDIVYYDKMNRIIKKIFPGVPEETIIEASRRFSNVIKILCNSTNAARVTEIEREYVNDLTHLRKLKNDFEQYFEDRYENV